MKNMIQLFAIAVTFGAAPMAFACDTCDAHKAKAECPKGCKKKCCADKKECPADCTKKCCKKEKAKAE